MDKVVIYLTRHGQTDWNKEKRMQGQGRDTLLNSTGIQQASKVAEMLSGKAFGIIGHSSLIRAKTTAEIIASSFPNAELVELEGLNEMSFGELEGRVVDEQLKSEPVWQKVANEWKAGNDLQKWPGGESPRDCIVRISAAVLKAIQMRKSSDEAILLVSHGSILRMFLNWVQGVGIQNDHKTPRLANCSVSSIVINVKSWMEEVKRDENFDGNCEGSEILAKKLKNHVKVRGINLQF